LVVLKICCANRIREYNSKWSHDTFKSSIILAIYLGMYLSDTTMCFLSSKLIQALELIVGKLSVTIIRQS